MRNTATKILIIFIVSLTALAYSACNQKSPKNSVRIGILEGPSTISFIQMIDENPFIDGKPVEIIIKSEPFQIQAMMMKQDLDFAVLPTVMAANLHNKGIKYRMVACPIWGTLYLVTHNKDITCYNDLEGKDVAVFSQGATADLLLQYNLKDKNVKCNSIDYRFKTNQEIAQALLMRETEVAVLSEPLVSLVLAQDSALQVVSRLNIEKFYDTPEKNIFIQSAFMVSDQFIKDHSYLIPDVCNAYANSCNFVNENPESASALLVRNNFAQDIKTATKSIDLCNIQYVSAFAIQRELFYYLQIFNEMDPEAIGGKQPQADFIYHTYK